MTQKIFRRWRAVGATVSHMTGPVIKKNIYRTNIYVVINLSLADANYLKLKGLEDSHRVYQFTLMEFRNIFYSKSFISNSINIVATLITYLAFHEQYFKWKEFQKNTKSISNVKQAMSF